MSIIVEGPDGAGKTTLIQKLQYDFPELVIHPRFSTSKEGPIEELALAVWQDLDQLTNRFYVYDRHPGISEYIYGHELPDRTVDPEFLKDGSIVINRRLQDDALIIWCRPPLEVLKLNLEPEEQMPGVVEHIDAIYEAYHIRELTWRGYSTVYDFTSQESYWAVRALVQRHIMRGF